jgi:hypothetical protein
VSATSEQRFAMECLPFKTSTPTTSFRPRLQPLLNDDASEAATSPASM